MTPNRRRCSASIAKTARWSCALVAPVRRRTTPYRPVRTGPARRSWNCYRRVACRRQRSLLGEPPGQLFGVELTDRVVDGGAIVRSTSRLVSSAITALAGPQDDSSSNAPLELGQGHVELDDPGSIHSGATPVAQERNGASGAAPRAARRAARCRGTPCAAPSPQGTASPHPGSNPARRFQQPGVERRRSGRCGTRVTPSWPTSDSRC